MDSNMNPYKQMSVVSSDKTAKSFRNGVLAGAIGAFILTMGALLIFNLVSGKNTNVVNASTLKKLDELSKYVDDKFYEDYDSEALQEGLLHGYMEGLGDPYSVYYTAEEYAQLQIDTSGEYYGIGAGLKQDASTMKVTVSKVYDGTPSQEAGLKKDDEIVSVDGIIATTMELTELVTKIRGDEGTTVSLEIKRGDSQETFVLDVERRNVQLPSVEAKMLDNGVGYIQITDFQSKTAEQFEQKLTELTEQEVKGLIIDVRGNPGGMLTSVTQIAQRILPAEKIGELPAGTIVYTQDKNGEMETYGTDDKLSIDCPIVVLMDENSASASEILAGAIKDYSDNGFIDATLVGKTTYGKGIVQTIYSLSDNDAVKITTSKYFTPNGKNIHKTGIEPDVEVEYKYTGDTEADYDMQYDSQVEKAIEVINEKL